MGTATECLPIRKPLVRLSMRLHGQQGENRVLRGGSWINNGRNCRSANRNGNLPENRNDNVGFRPVSPIKRMKERNDRSGHGTRPI